MHGARRVIIFCLLTAVLPTILLIIPLYLRHSLFADEIYRVAESDVLEVGEGVSSVFCQEHSLKMNSSFNAYQITGKPEIGTIRKHIRLKKSMKLPDDTLEYWGFYLPKNSTVHLTVCSRFDGAKILVVRGEKNLKTCGLLDHTKLGLPVGSLARGQGEVKVTYETNAQEIITPDKDRIMKNFRESNQTSHRRRRSSVSVVEKPKDNDENDASEVEDTEGMRTYRLMKDIAENYIEKYHKVGSTNFRTFEESVLGHKLRHSKGRKNSKHNSTGKKSIDEKLGLSNSDIEERIQSSNEIRRRRDTLVRTPHNLDAKIAHGGTALNFTDVASDDSSISSFEKNLFECYHGSILLQSDIPPSDLCINTTFLTTKDVKNMKTSHDVVVDGYYYYIFYSDNDKEQNDIHAVFDIHKPTYQYANVSERCLNATECSFSVSFFTDATVVVEVPTRDGIEHDDDITFLVSTCQPRMAVYMIFPILVLFLILGCAFL